MKRPQVIWIKFTLEALDALLNHLRTSRVTRACAQLSVVARVCCNRPVLLVVVVVLNNPPHFNEYLHHAKYDKSTEKSERPPCVVAKLVNKQLYAESCANCSKNAVEQGFPERTLVHLPASFQQGARMERTLWLTLLNIA